MTIRVAINGFGRIGRQILRAIYENGRREDVEVVAVNDLANAETIAHLFEYDSVHGKLDMDIRSKGDAIEVDGRSIAFTSIKDPEQLKWKELGVDVAAECTGLFRDRESATKHLTAGARKVIISAPAKDPDITIVMGVNDDQYDPATQDVISNASCTTNCLAPVAKVLDDAFGDGRGLGPRFFICIPIRTSLLQSRAYVVAHPKLFHHCAY